MPGVAGACGECSNRYDLATQPEFKNSQLKLRHNLPTWGNPLYCGSRHIEPDLDPLLRCSPLFSAAETGRPCESNLSWHISWLSPPLRGKGRSKLPGLLLAFEPFEAKPELGFASKASLEGLEWLQRFCLEWNGHNEENVKRRTIFRLVGSLQKDFWGMERVKLI